MSRHIRVSRRYKKVHESTHPIMCRLILSRFYFTGAGKRLGIDTYASRVDTKRVHESTHPIMCRLILSHFCFTGAGKSYVSMHSSMGRHIAVQSAVFLLFYTVFTFFFIIIRYGCNISVSTSSPL